MPLTLPDDYAELARRLEQATNGQQRDDLLDLWLELKRLDDPTGAWPWPDVRESQEAL